MNKMCEPNTYPAGQKVELSALTDRAKQKLLLNGNIWTVIPLPSILMKSGYKEVRKGWLLVESETGQKRFVHVHSDQSFNVCFIEHDEIRMSTSTQNSTIIGAQQNA